MKIMTEKDHLPSSFDHSFVRVNYRKIIHSGVHIYFILFSPCLLLSVISKNLRITRRERINLVPERKSDFSLDKYLAANIRVLPEKIRNSSCG